MSRNEVIRLQDIQDAIELIHEYAARANDFHDKREDQLLQDAVLFRLSIIGEAVKNLSNDLTVTEPEVDWSAWAGLRDIISHSYFRVDMAVIWDTVDADLPQLSDAVDRLLR